MNRPLIIIGDYHSDTYLYYGWLSRYYQIFENRGDISWSTRNRPVLNHNSSFQARTSFWTALFSPYQPHFILQTALVTRVDQGYCLPHGSARRGVKPYERENVTHKWIQQKPSAGLHSSHTLGARQDNTVYVSPTIAFAKAVNFLAFYRHIYYFTSDA